MSTNTVSLNQARIAISALLAGLIACNAFAMCSDVMSSLLFAGVGGYFSLALLSIVFLLWLNLYLCGGKPLDPFELEKNYYHEKFIQSFPKHNVEHKAAFKLLVVQWLRLAELRHALVCYQENPVDGKSLDYNGMVEKLIRKWQRDSTVEAAHLDAFRTVAHNYQTYLQKKATASTTIPRAHYRFEDADFNVATMSQILTGIEQLNLGWLEILKAREVSIFKPKYILFGVSVLALANVLINALTMFGGANGVAQTIALLCGVQFPLVVTHIIALIFLCAGGYASYQLTRPMIRHFGYDLELYFQDMTHFHKKFSWLNVLAGFMAFFSAIASATFALYNTPLVGMLPVALVGCAPLIQGFVFVIAFFSVFSLYFVSVTSKFSDWRQAQQGSFHLDRILLPLLIIAASVALDWVCLPSYLHGLLELLVMLEVAHENYGFKGILFTVSLFGSFAFCLTSFHQICVLFHPGPVMLALCSVVTIFQFATFAVTFYYGCCRAFSLDRTIIVDADTPASAADMKSISSYERTKHCSSSSSSGMTSVERRSSLDSEGEIVKKDGRFPGLQSASDIDRK
jgi:hypothetical protein